MPKLQLLATDGNKTIKSGKMVYSKTIMLMLLETLNERYMDFDKTILLHNRDKTIVLQYASKGEYI